MITKAERRKIKPDTKILLQEARKLINKNVTKIEINLCKICRCEYKKEGAYNKFYAKGVCSDLCEELLNPPKIYHTCSCGNSLKAYRYRSGKFKGKSTGMYPKYCEKCIKAGKHRNFNRLSWSTKKKNEII